MGEVPPVWFVVGLLAVLFWFVFVVLDPLPFGPLAEDDASAVDSAEGSPSPDDSSPVGSPSAPEEGSV